MISNSINVLNLASTIDDGGEVMDERIRGLKKVTHSLSTLLVTLQLHWEMAGPTRKPYVRPIRYQLLPDISDFPDLEEGQDLEGLRVHEKFVCWTPAKFWIHMRMSRAAFHTIYDDLKDTLTEKLGGVVGGGGIWDYTIPKYLILAGTLMYLGGFKYQAIESILGIETSTFYKLVLLEFVLVIYMLHVA